MSSDVTISRRKFLLGAVLALPTLGVLVNTLSAADAADMAAPDLAAYRPEFLSSEEWAFMLSACDRLIPADGRGPGALETNVPIFIDQQLHGDLGADIYLQGPFDPHAPKELGYQLPYTTQEIYRRGIALTNRYCRRTLNKPFHALDAAGQDTVMAALAGSQVAFSDDGEAALTAAQFFGQMLADTKNGYLSDPMYGGNKGMKAWIAIGFPGARASFLEWVSQHNVKYPLGPVSLNGQRG